MRADLVSAMILAHNGDRERVFDWDKAARRIMEINPRYAAAGLGLDWKWTGGIIWYKGEPISDSATYLCSDWATPELRLDDKVEACWRYQDETEWDADTRWPASALAIVGALKARELTTAEEIALFHEGILNFLDETEEGE